jgi:hypothetical protein
MMTDAPKLLKDRPNELGTPTAYGLTIGLLTAFGVDAIKAGAIAGIVAAVAPGIITFLVELRRRKG